MSNTTPEFRAYNEIVSRKDGSRRVGGICAPYNKPSRDLTRGMSMGGLIEVIGTRAFAGGLGLGFPGVVANLEHEPRALLATVDSGTLDISNTDTGLGYEFE